MPAVRAVPGVRARPVAVAMPALRPVPGVRARPVAVATGTVGATFAVGAFAAPVEVPMPALTDRPPAAGLRARTCHALRELLVRVAVVLPNKPAAAFVPSTTAMTPSLPLRVR